MEETPPSPPQGDPAILLCGPVGVERRSQVAAEEKAQELATRPGCASGASHEWCEGELAITPQLCFIR